MNPKYRSVAVKVIYKRVGSKARPNMEPTWSKYGPDMVPKSRHSIKMFLRPYLPFLENFRALAGLEVKLGQTWSKHGTNMALTWSQKVYTPYSYALNNNESVLKILELWLVWK